MTPYEGYNSDRSAEGMAQGAEIAAREFLGDEDFAFLEVLASQPEDNQSDPTPFIMDVAELASYILENDPASFESALERDPALTYERYQSEAFRRLVVLGLEYGVACGDGACANYLGALYYMGDVVGQDYRRAKELYEIAEAKGVMRAMLNLGYIYEYGRCGEPDRLRAYMQYAKVAALTDNTEALYKMGDMYSRAKVVERDLRAAFVLYDRSFGEAEGEIEQAQPAIRIANLISDPANEEYGIPYDPMAALGLYQLAERGLRQDIAQGQTYYRRRLQEALEGQDRMRRILDGEEDIEYGGSTES